MNFLLICESIDLQHDPFTHFEKSNNFFKLKFQKKCLYDIVSCIILYSQLQPMLHRNYLRNMFQEFWVIHLMLTHMGDCSKTKCTIKPVQDLVIMCQQLVKVRNIWYTIVKIKIDRFLMFLTTLSKMEYLRIYYLIIVL